MNSQRMLLAGLTLCVFAAQAQDTTARADNTRINERDRGSDTLTPEDQSERPADVALTATIRRALLDQKGLSIDGRNIKIITRNHTVTLRGPVKDSSERELVDRIARKAAGTASVDNQIDVL